MADKSSSQIVHQNNHPASAVANNYSVSPQHDASVLTAPPNIPAASEIGSAEAHAEPTMSNAARENVTAEWLVKQLKESIENIELIDKAKRKSDLYLLLNEIKALSEPAYQCTKVWRSLLMEIGQDYFDLFQQQMLWLLGLCKGFVATNTNQDSSTPAFPRGYVRQLSNQFCTCALQACLQHLGSLTPFTNKLDKRAYLLSAYYCTKPFESYIKKLKKAVNSSLDGIDLQLVMRQFKDYDAMRCMGQHTLKELGLNKEQFGGIGHRSVASRVNIGANNAGSSNSGMDLAANQLFGDRE